MLAPTLSGSKPLPKPTLDAAEAGWQCATYQAPHPGDRRKCPHRPPWSLPPCVGPLCSSLYYRLLHGGVARGGDILPVVGGLTLLSVTAFTHRVPEMAFDLETFLDITQCPLGTKSGTS